MKITLSLLEHYDACAEGIQYFREHQLEDIEASDLIDRLMKEDNFEWANWLMTRLLNRTNKAKYAIYCAELVLPIWLKKYPNDDRPQKTIQAAKNVLENDFSTESITELIKDAHSTIAGAIDAIAAAIADADAEAAVRAAYAAIAAADASVRAAYAFADAAKAAADAAEATPSTKEKIIQYGLELLKSQQGENNHEKN